MNNTKSNNPIYPAVISTGAGSAAGVVATSTVATSAVGAGGVTGYFAGIGSLVAHIGCETAAMTAFGTVVAGPVVGGVVGYGIYRGVKKIVRG